FRLSCSDLRQDILPFSLIVTLFRVRLLLRSLGGVMRLSSLARIAGLLVLASCNTVVGTDQPVGPLSLSVVSGNNQSGPPGTELPDPLVAVVVDSRGRAVSGQIF